jgi:hypothetical protein
MLRPPDLQAQTARRLTAGLVSVVLHLGLAALIVLLGGPGAGTYDDARPAPRLVWLDASVADRQEDPGVRSAPQAIPESTRIEQPILPRIPPPTVPPPDVDIPRIDAGASRLVEVDADLAGAVPQTIVADDRSSFTIPQEQASDLLQRVEHLAGELATAHRTRVTWQQDGRVYDAELVLEPAPDGVEPERAIAKISTEDQGRQLRTWISLKRLPYSHYAKLIDRWDPMVQLHDDEIVGRMHINSRFNVLYGTQAAPRVLGKVTTAAGGFNVERRGRRQDSAVFVGGIETSAARIPLFEQGGSFEQAGSRANARTHELAGDTRIRFLGEGGYSWREGKSGAWQYAGPPARQPVYFIASRGAVYVQGTVAGRFLVFAPRRIVVEGSLVYASDPRSDPDSDDYLGLVSDRDIEVAPPAVTGPGDLHIQAALFARRRIVVMDTGHRRPATLHILGSLAAGTLSESEPRYAMKVEYDRRFDRQRPPGFPSTNRFATEDWDRQWTVVPEPAVSAGY